jgi:hypothetical protein
MGIHYLFPAPMFFMPDDPKESKKIVDPFIE